MKLHYSLMGAIFACAAVAAMSLTGCAGTLDKLSSAYHVATSAEVTRNEALLAVQSTKTLQDLATSYIAACVVNDKVDGPCAPVAIEAIHKALVAARKPRDDLASFAQTHAGAELGASGLYDALITAKTSLAAVLQQYGYAVPT